MSDHVTLPGAGVVVASDDVGGAQYQRVKLTAGQADDATPIKGTPEGLLSISLDDLCAAFTAALTKIIDPMTIDPATGRLRMSLDAIAASLTLATITTVTTVTTCSTVTSVTNKTQEGGVPSSGMVFDAMALTWASSVRRAIG